MTHLATDLGNLRHSAARGEAGRLRILLPGTRIGSPRSDPDNPERSTANDLFVRPTDREPMFGFSACLTKAQFSHVRSRTDFWAVDAEEYSDTLWITRDEFYKTFSDHWPTGRPDMVELAYYHYQVGLILNGKTEMDGDHDGVPTQFGVRRQQRCTDLI